MMTKGYYLLLQQLGVVVDKKEARLPIKSVNSNVSCSE